MLAHHSPQRLPFAPGTILASRSYEEAAATLNGNLSESRIVSPQKRGAQADILFNLRTLPEIKLFGACWGDAVSVRSTPLACWHGILPLAGGIVDLRADRQVKAGGMILFAPGHEVDVIWRDGTQAIVIALDNRLLRSHLEAEYEMGIPSVVERVLYIEQEHPALVSLGNLLRLTDAEFRQGQGLLSLPVAQRQLQSLFCENLLHLVPALRSLPERHILPGGLKRAVEYIHEHLEQPWSLEELVRISGVSRRSLEQAFRDKLQTSPQRYLQQCRLKAARDCLRKARPGDVQLAELAYRLGFSQPSHFTTAYKQAFGELPSQTLARFF